MVAVGAVSTGVTVAIVRLRTEPPRPGVTLHAADTVVVQPRTPPAIVEPGSGSLALEATAPRMVPGAAQRIASVDADHQRPIASVAKTLTAIEVLRLRPLGAGDPGPQYRITAADVADYRTALAAGGSVVPVSQGEVFTERQLLLALMLPSGNNIAETLARWASGTRDAFLAAANDTARGLGMASTHLADPSGFESATVSTASDLVRLGRSVLDDPALSEIVTTPQVTLPDGTVAENLDTGLKDVHGWLGIKTGNSDDAGGCLLFAARRAPDGDGDPQDAITVVGAVLGQHSSLAAATGADDRGAAIYAAESAVNSALSGYTPLHAAALLPDLSGTVGAAWGPLSPVDVGKPDQPGNFVVREGTALQLQAMSLPVPAPIDAGAPVGRLDALAGGTVVASWPVVALNRIAAPDWTWRLQHG